MIERSSTCLQAASCVTINFPPTDSKSAGQVMRASTCRDTVDIRLIGHLQSTEGDLPVVRRVNNLVSTDRRTRWPVPA